MDALLGYTGLVGSHLRENLSPDETVYFDSKNFTEATQREFRNVYCACVPAVKWWANKNPSQDFEHVQRILDVLTSMRFTGTFVLISTIDVHDHAHTNQSESCEHPSEQPYGRHRFELENQMRKVMGAKLLVVRLPALFGLGLKKNMLFDLLEQHMVQQVNINTAFQWYSLSWLWEDLQHIQKMDAVRTVNLYPPPIESAEIVSRFFASSAGKLVCGERFEYNQPSRIMPERRSKADVLTAMEEFIRLRAYTSGPNHMVVSNMAWEPKHDEHAIFLMKRFGIQQVEVLPTKYSPWDEFFRDPHRLKKHYERDGIRVYSLQSLLHGVPGDFLSSPEAMKDHLRDVMRAAKSIGCSALVLGSPKKRVHGLNEEDFSEALEDVQCCSREVKLCLEPNAREYGCHVGADIASVLRMTRRYSFYMNLDTGNATMTRDTLPAFTSSKIAHVQISAPYLEPVTDDTYAELDRTGVTAFVAHAVGSCSDIRVSLEASLGEARVGMLGDQMRRFAGYCCHSFQKEDKI